MIETLRLALWRRGPSSCPAFLRRVLSTLSISLLSVQSFAQQATDTSEQQAASRVVLLTGFSDSAPVLAQLRIELLAMGFTVVVSESSSSNLSINQQMRTRAANVAVLGRPDGHVEVLVDGADSLLITPPDDATSRIISMRIAEQIRASLLLRDVEPEEEVEEPERPSREVEPVVEPPKAPVLLTDLGVGYEVGPGELGGLGRGALHAHYLPFRNFGLVGFALAPVQPLQVSDGENSADIWAWHFGVGLEFRKRWAEQFELSLAAGGGGSSVRVSGSAVAPERASTEVVHPAHVFGSVGGSWHTSSPLYLGGRVMGFYSIPTLRVHFVDDVVAQRDLFVVPEIFVGVALF